MCGRFLLSLIPEEYAGLLRIAHVPNFSADLFMPRMNIAPTEQILIARGSEDRELAAARWGMLAPWASRDEAFKRPIFNARSETAWEKPLFKAAASSQRCVVPASGFYEWQKPATPRGRKQPHLIRRADGAPMFFAGLWSSWRPRGEPEAATTENCAILTTAPNEQMAPIHDRMPVILSDSAAVDRWLDAQPSDRGDFEDLLRPEAAPALEIRTIERVGNNRRAGSEDRTPPPTLFD